MRILCVADHIDPLVYSLQIKDRFRSIDLVIGAGDLPMEYLSFIASSLNKIVLFIFGNHNLKHFAAYKKRPPAGDPLALETSPQAHFGSTYIDNKILHHRNLLIAGLGGSIRYNQGENQFTEWQMTLRILLLIPRLLFNRLVHGRYLDILVTHAAPLGIHDIDDPAHRGFKCFLWFMRRFRPRYLVHGHIHLYDPNENRETKYFHTMVINVYDHYVLTVH
jgi:Icc-related predicted phosphoesterase